LAYPDLKHLVSKLADLLAEFQLNIEALTIQGASAALQACNEAAGALGRSISERRLGAPAARLASQVRRLRNNNSCD
jgi:hypothetical protein